MLRKQKEPIKEVNWKLVDFSPLKDFIDYGMNKTLINLKLRRLTDIQVREQLSKKKEGADWMDIIKMVMVVVVIGVIAFSMITQFLNYQSVTEDNIKVNRQLGECEGQLARCQSQAGAASSSGPGTIIHG